MDLRGISRRRYTPTTPPPQTAKARRNRSAPGSQGEVPVFEPYEETLPLQSGFYSYAIDETGRFRVKWGNTRSHAAMVSGAPLCAAGRFRVNRHGNTVHVVINSTDYAFSCSKTIVEYIVESFQRHTAFSLSPRAIFQFHTGITDKQFFSTTLDPVSDPHEAIRILDEEGLRETVEPEYTPAQVVRRLSYTPPRPPRLYSMHLDQVVTSIDGTDDAGFDYGPPADRLDVTHVEFRAGKNNFVIDPDGWLIVGMSGHQILSGGNKVGAAGHIHFHTSGVVSRLDLNFSGHYRPPLSAEYVRYTYRAISGHPLITLANDCEYSGRWFDEVDVNTHVIKFDRDELESDDPGLEDQIDSLSW